MNKITKIFTKEPRKYDMTDLYHMTKQMKEQVCMIWLTMVGYIIYLEFFKDVV
jgi:hypothetical protein